MRRASAKRENPCFLVFQGKKSLIVRIGHKARPRFYDSPAPKPAIFFNELFMAARHEEGCYEENIYTHG